MKLSILTTFYKTDKQVKNSLIDMCMQTDIKQADRHTNLDRISESPEGHLITKQENICLNDMCMQTDIQAGKQTY